VSVCNFASCTEYLINEAGILGFIMDNSCGESGCRRLVRHGDVGTLTSSSIGGMEEALTPRASIPAAAKL